NIVCLVNLQHDCTAEGKCAQHKVVVQQEREDTCQTRYSVKHSDNARFILNTQSLHNIRHIHPAL
ncbi:hypothetical protein BDV93DRAFT_393540, partial [Ceratobasidium sp. AG-I]